MAQDEKDQNDDDSSPDPTAETGSDDEYAGFVDTDGSFDDAVTDRDDDAAPPLSGGIGGGASGDNAPDPGYAAFSDDFDDPLADWPGPEGSQDPFDRNPEPAADAVVPPVAKGPLDAAPRTMKVTKSEENYAAALGTPAFPEEAGPADDAEPLSSGFSALSAGNGDSDEPTAKDLASDDDPEATAETEHKEDIEGDTEESPVPDALPAEEAPDSEPDPAPWADEPPMPLEPDAVAKSRSAETAAQVILDEALASPGELPAPDDIDSAIPDLEEDDFVDEFLNDLDPPDEEESPDLAPEPGDDDNPPAGASAITSPSAIEAAGYAFGADPELDSEQETMSRPRAGQNGHAAATAEAMDDSSESERRIPLVMIGVVVLALILLGLGGYGVVQERQTLEAEIRELQARLATAMTPEESEAARAAQQLLADEGEALVAEVAALEAENGALQARVAALEETLETQETAAKEAAEAQAAAAKAAASAPAPKPADSTPSRPVASGEWFVNFGSYARRDIADRWAQRLSVSAGSVVVQSAEAGGRTLYRVRVVGLANRDSAERIATGLEREFDLPRLWVGKN